MQKFKPSFIIDLLPFGLGLVMFIFLLLWALSLPKSQTEKAEAIVGIAPFILLSYFYIELRIRNESLKQSITNILESEKQFTNKSEIRKLSELEKRLKELEKESPIRWMFISIFFTLFLTVSVAIALYILPKILPK